MNSKTFHPASELFPLLGGKEFDQLVEDIRANGLLESIWLSRDGQIIDGRNRYRACDAAQVEPRFQELPEDIDPWSFVWSLNAERRHLEQGQKVAIRIIQLKASQEWQNERTKRSEAANQKRSQATKERPRADDGTLLASSSAVSRDTALDRERVQLGQSAGVGEATAARGLALESKRPDLLEKVAAGEVTLNEACRQMKKAEVAQQVQQLPSGKYRVFYADPPWKYGNSGSEIDQYGPAERHYPPMSIAELSLLDIKTMAADDSVLFIWVTSPLLAECWPVIRAWGFTYKTSFVWDKIKHNFGHYNSVRHELLLVCTRGSCTPDVAEKHDSVISIERTEHSKKPQYFRDLIEKLYPHGKRIELFAREQAENWEAWGNDVTNRGLQEIQSHAN